MLSARLNIVVALPCEARPLINFYKLQQQHAWPVFCDPDKKIYLAVSGPGKVKAACATTLLANTPHSHPTACFLNLGIAGADQHAIGEIFCIHKITDNDTQQSWYPTLRHNTPLASEALITVAKAKLNYRPNSLIDMEAAGFFQAAHLFVSQEHNQLLKIVSDNTYSADIKIKPKAVEQLINAQMNTIDMVVNDLLQLSREESKRQLHLIDFAWITERWHFSQYQQYQLKELLRRWQVIYKNTPLRDKIATRKEAKEVLNDLSTRLEAATYAW